MSMAICEERHEAVVYEDWNFRSGKRSPCPVCEVLDRESVLEDRIQAAEDEMEKLMADLEEYKHE